MPLAAILCAAITLFSCCAADLDADLKAGQELLKGMKFAPDFSKTFYAQITTTTKMQGCGSVSLRAKKSDKGIVLEEDIQGFCNDDKFHIVHQGSVVSDAEFNALEYAENSNIQMADGPRKSSRKLTIRDHKLTKLSITEGKESTKEYPLTEDAGIWNVSEPVILQILDLQNVTSFALRELNTAAFGSELKEMDIGGVKVKPPPPPSPTNIWRFSVIRHEDGSFKVDVSRPDKAIEKRYEFDKSGTLTKILLFLPPIEDKSLSSKLISETIIITKEQFEQAKAKLEAEKIVPPNETKTPADKWQNDY